MDTNLNMTIYAIIGVEIIKLVFGQKVCIWRGSSNTRESTPSVISLECIICAFTLFVYTWTYETVSNRRAFTRWHAVALTNFSHFSPANGSIFFAITITVNVIMLLHIRLADDKLNKA